MGFQGPYELLEVTPTPILEALGGEPLFLGYLVLSERFGFVHLLLLGLTLSLEFLRS